ncbi:MAG: lipoprotein, partial [uncultured bacterium]
MVSVDFTNKLKNKKIMKKIATKFAFQCKPCSMKVIFGMSLCLLAFVAYNNYAFAANDATLSFAGTPATVNVGDTFTITANENPGTNANIRAVDIFIQFDPAIFQLNSITNNVAAFNTEMANNIPPTTAAGTASFGTARLGGIALVGAQDVATFSFTALAEGADSAISFTNGTAIWDSGVNVTAPGGLNGAEITVLNAGGSNPPVLTQVTPVPHPTSDSTPDYTFTSDQDGDITYGGACSGSTPDTVVASVPKTITFNSLPDAVYDDCTIRVTAASTDFNTLSVNSFRVDTAAPDTSIT